jgi:glycosyltransferase involved in cell wall biosynthesis
VIPYFRLDHHVVETVASVRAQTYPRIEIVVVNDGSLRGEDTLLYDGTLGDVRVVTQPNSGLSASRNAGIAHARGRYVLPLDADDVLEPTFVERCVEALEHEPDLAYVTTWVRYVDPDGEPLTEGHAGYSPYGNWSRLMERNNVGGTCAAVFRRRLFDIGYGYSHDLTSYEDWLLYYDLHRAGHHGGVIPERLFRYRVRPDSMMRTDGRPETKTIFDEIRAHVRENEVQWVASRH